MQNTELPEKIEPTSLNFQTELAAQLAELVPEAMSDGKLDVTKLREMVNGDAENSPEKFGLFWPGKRAAQALAQIPTTATLTPAPEESVDWENTKNIFIEGDNLEVLKALQNSYRRKVKMIYIDPPYNTGKEFIYPDKFTEGLQGYLEYTGQKNEAGENIESRPETGGRKHSNWLSMMYPRLQLAKSLLTDDGVIFISIDDNEQANLKKLCDDVFGEDNFIALFVITVAPAGTQSSVHVAQQHDYCLMYRRSDSFKVLKQKLSDEELANKYPESDEKGSFSVERLWKRGVGGKKEDVPSLHFPVYYNEGTGEIFIDDEVLDPTGLVKIIPYQTTGVLGRWTWSKKKMLNEKEKLVVRKIAGEYKLHKKRYKFNDEGLLPKSIIDSKIARTELGSLEIKDLMNSKVFDYPKCSSLISHLISFSTNNDSLILDFFSGSGTTAHAVMKLNAEDGGSRRHIQVQLPELVTIKSEAYKAGYKTIADISKERIRLAGKKIREDYADKIAQRNTPLDTGFRVYKLTPSNFVQWDENRAKDNIQQSVLDFAANKKPDAAPEALLAEIMLQARMPLSAHIEKRDLQSGGWVYVVDSGNLIAYVANEQITEAQANEIADLAPAKLIVLDSAFNGNNALKINVANICKEKFIKEFKTI